MGPIWEVLRSHDGLKER